MPPPSAFSGMAFWFRYLFLSNIGPYRQICIIWKGHVGQKDLYLFCSQTLDMNIIQTVLFSL